MPRYLSKLSILSYIVHISIPEVKEYVKDRRECCKSAAMRCCLSLKESIMTEKGVHSQGVMVPELVFRDICYPFLIESRAYIYIVVVITNRV